MDKYHTLQNILESLFALKDLKSWTIHENSSGSTCTLRFSNPNSGSEENAKTTTFKKKSNYQVNRDRRRMEHYNTRSRANSVVTIEDK